MADSTVHDTAPATVGGVSGGKRRGPRAARIRRLATAGVAVSVLGAGVGTSYALAAQATGGASSPAGAVQTLLGAADHSDVLGALSVLAPGERAALEPNLVTLVHQLTRLQVLSPDASLRSVRGLGLQFSGIRTHTTVLTPDLATVSLTAGTVTGETNLAQLPLGRFVRRLAGGRMKGTSQSTGSAVTGRAGIATVQEGGRWYVSLGYTIAVDALRAKGGTGAPPPGGITPVGHRSAAGAVRDFLTAASRYDLRRVLADLPPGEFGALQAYAPLFLARAQRSLDAAAKRATIRLGPVRARTHSVPGGALVQVAFPDLTVHIQPSTTIAYRHGCLVETAAGRTVHVCGSTMSPRAALATLPASIAKALAPVIPIFERLRHERMETGILAVDESGRWYVSPTGTLLHDVDTVLSGFRPSDLPAFAKAITRLEQLSRTAVSTPVQATA